MARGVPLLTRRSRPNMQVLQPHGGSVSCRRHQHGSHDRLLGVGCERSLTQLSYLRQQQLNLLLRTGAAELLVFERPLDRGSQRLRRRSQSDGVQPMTNAAPTTSATGLLAN